MKIIHPKVLSSTQADSHVHSDPYMPSTRESIFGTVKIGKDEKYFNLGGTSLNATTLIILRF